MEELEKQFTDEMRGLIEKFIEESNKQVDENAYIDSRSSAEQPERPESYENSEYGELLQQLHETRGYAERRELIAKLGEMKESNIKEIRKQITLAKREFLKKQKEQTKAKTDKINGKISKIDNKMQELAKKINNITKISGSLGDEKEVYKLAQSKKKEHIRGIKDLLKQKGKLQEEIKEIEANSEAIRGKYRNIKVRTTDDAYKALEQLGREEVVGEKKQEEAEKPAQEQEKLARENNEHRSYLEEDDIEEAKERLQKWAESDDRKPEEIESEYEEPFAENEKRVVEEKQEESRKEEVVGEKKQEEAEKPVQEQEEKQEEKMSAFDAAKLKFDAANSGLANLAKQINEQAEKRKVLQREEPRMTVRKTEPEREEEYEEAENEDRSFGKVNPRDLLIMYSAIDDKYLIRDIKTKDIIRSVEREDIEELQQEDVEYLEKESGLNLERVENIDKNILNLLMEYDDETGDKKAIEYLNMLVRTKEENKEKSNQIKIEYNLKTLYDKEKLNNNLRRKDFTIEQINEILSIANGAKQNGVAKVKKGLKVAAWEFIDKLVAKMPKRKAISEKSSIEEDLEDKIISQTEKAVTKEERKTIKEKREEFIEGLASKEQQPEEGLESSYDYDAEEQEFQRRAEAIREGQEKLQDEINNDKRREMMNGINKSEKSTDDDDEFVL